MATVTGLKIEGNNGKTIKDFLTDEEIRKIIFAFEFSPSGLIVKPHVVEEDLRQIVNYPNLKFSNLQAVQASEPFVVGTIHFRRLRYKKIIRQFLQNLNPQRNLGDVTSIELIPAVIKNTLTLELHVKRTEIQSFSERIILPGDNLQPCPPAKPADEE
jgi:hypothetical protein